MTNFKINNRTISLTDDQLLLTKQIAILGFVSKSHINMLYSIIKGQQSLLSQHVFSKMVNKLHIWDSVSTSQKRNHTTITVYVLGRTGRSLLRMLHYFARDSQSFSINNHNMQATETLIQALYASYFKAQALGNNNSSLLFNEHKLSVESSLGSVLNLSSFDVLFQSESPLKPVVSRANDAFFKRMLINQGFQSF